MNQIKNPDAGEQIGEFLDKDKINNNSWLGEFELLVNRYSGLGISPDVASLTLIECYGLYLFLRSLQ